MIPPRAEYLAATPLREDVTVVVRVDETGRATLDGCARVAAECDAIRDALERSRMVPALRDGQAIVSRVRVVLPGAPAPESTARESPAAPAPDDELGVTAVVTRPEPGARDIPLERARDLPGTLGDPFRAALVMPGVVPFASLLPYFYFRGAPVNGSVYYYDGIPLPTLYHLAGGPAVVHPRMVGAIRIHRGIAPARYGRHVGAVVTGAGPPTFPASAVGEVELRAFDGSAFVSVPVDDVTFTGAVRYGYPGLILEAVAPPARLQFFDYQARLDVRLSDRETLQVIWLGAHDDMDLGRLGEDLGIRFQLQSVLTFHRGEARFVHRSARTEIGIAIRAGYDASELPGVLAVNVAHVGPRVWFRWREGPVTVRVGADLVASWGSLDAIDGGLILGQPPYVHYAGSRRRLAGGVYGELRWRPWPELSILAGLRGDLWTADAEYEAAIDPRLRLVWRPIAGLEVHAAAGVARMPAVFMIPLPGLAELPLRDGLQTSIQSEVGIAADRRTDLGRTRVALRLYYHQYEGLMFTQQDANPSMDVSALCRSGFCFQWEPNFRTSGRGYGLEIEARSDLGPNVRAIFTYTTGWAEANPLTADVRFTPSYDVRHVFNLVLAGDTGDGFGAGVRGFLRSGTTDGFIYIDDSLELRRYEQQLPWYGRLDVSAHYAWDAGWARLRVGAEMVNALFFLGGEPLRIRCPADIFALPPIPPREPPREPCPVVSQAPVFIPNVGIRGTFE